MPPPPPPHYTQSSTNNSKNTSPRPPRHRSHTLSSATASASSSNPFSFASWNRRSPSSSRPPAPSTPSGGSSSSDAQNTPMDLEGVLNALSPPNQPSLNLARTLVGMMKDTSSHRSIKWETILPILKSLLESGSLVITTVGLEIFLVYVSTIDTPFPSTERILLLGLLRKTGFVPHKTIPVLKSLYFFGSREVRVGIEATILEYLMELMGLKSDYLPVDELVELSSLARTLVNDENDTIPSSSSSDEEERKVYRKLEAFYTQRIIENLYPTTTSTTGGPTSPPLQPTTGSTIIPESQSPTPLITPRDLPSPPPLQTQTQTQTKEGSQAPQLLHRRHPSSSGILPLNLVQSPSPNRHHRSAASVSPSLISAQRDGSQSATSTTTGSGTSHHASHHTFSYSSSSHATSSTSLLGGTSGLVFPSPPSTTLIALTEIYLTFAFSSSPATTSALSRILPTLFLLCGRYLKPVPRLTMRNTTDLTSSSTFSSNEPETQVSGKLDKVLRRVCESGLLGDQDLLKEYIYPPREPSSSSSTTSSHGVVRHLRALGAMRTLRNMMRSRIYNDMRDAYVKNMTGGQEMTWSGGVELDTADIELMNKAYHHTATTEDSDSEDNLLSVTPLLGKIEEEAGVGWGVSYCSGWLGQSVEGWIESSLSPNTTSVDKEGIDRVILEALGIVKDVLQEKEVDGEEDEDYCGGYEEIVVREVLKGGVRYVENIRNEDGSPYRLPLERPREALNPVLQCLCDLLSPLSNPAPAQSINHLPMIALSIAPNLTDAQTASLVLMTELTPLSETWLEDFEALFREFCGSESGGRYGERQNTRKELFKSATKVYETVRDWPAYRRPLGKVIYDWWKVCVESGVVGVEGSGDSRGVWKILRKEMVMRISEEEGVEKDEDQGTPPSQPPLQEEILSFLLKTSSSCVCHEEEDIVPSSGVLATPILSASSATSPIISRMQSTTSLPQSPISITEQQVPPQPLPPPQRTGVMPSLVSHILGSASRTNSSMNVISPPLPAGTDPDHTPPDTPLGSTRLEDPSLGGVEPPCHGASAATVLLDAFSELAFTPQASSIHAEQLFGTLLTILKDSTCSKTRIVVLQYLMRLRSDRDHRVYLVGSIDEQVAPLGVLLAYAKSSSGASTPVPPEPTPTTAPTPPKPDARIGRSRPTSRGRAIPNTSSSRSRSRAPRATLPPPPTLTRLPLWSVPETLPFSVPESTSEDDVLFVQPSTVILTYQHPDMEPIMEGRECLAVSEYVMALADILEHETDWDVLTYVLVHLPCQLSNKHFFCGPHTRESILRLHQALCRGLADETLGSTVDLIPTQFKLRDIQSIGYHILAVLVSYRTMFDSQQRDAIVKVFFQGLMAGIPNTLVCCVSGLILCAYELEEQLSRHLPPILERLELIMSNAAIAVHILALLNAIGTIPTLFSNFTEDHYRMVFSIALKYLEAHNNSANNSNLSFSLTQHVLVMTFNVIYTWFLALDLDDRPTYVNFITRQVLLANDNVLSEQAEVCFDWLMRYTYASVDPKPAASVLRQSILGKPVPETAEEESEAPGAKWWILGNAILSVRTHATPGWMEIETRRPSGKTRFLVRAENFPHVPVGDVDPDMISLPAVVMSNRRPARMSNPSTRISQEENKEVSVKLDQDESEVLEALTPEATSSTDGGEEIPKPDAMTGYVWSGTAPSQRRKDVSIRSPFLELQLSPYPDPEIAHRGISITDLPQLGRTIRTLDLYPVIDTHAVGVLYVAPGQKELKDILDNAVGSPAYSRFLEGLGRLIKIRGQQDVYVGGLDEDKDGEYAIAWWDDIGQVVYHVATMMPTTTTSFNNKLRHIGNDFVKIVWNDSGISYDIHTVSGDFTFVNIIIEAHSSGIIGAYSNDGHENEYFRVSMQRKEGMPDFGPIGQFKIISAASLPSFVRSTCFLADWFCRIYRDTGYDAERTEYLTSWRHRLQAIKRLKARAESSISASGISADNPNVYDFTAFY